MQRQLGLASKISAGLSESQFAPSTEKQEPQQKSVTRNIGFDCAEIEVINFLQCGQVAVAVVPFIECSSETIEF